MHFAPFAPGPSLRLRGWLWLGVAPTPGRDAVVRKFSDAGAGKLFNFPCHYVETCLKHRVPFDEAFSGKPL